MGEEWHWSDSALSAKLLDMIDGEFLVPLVFAFVPFALWKFIPAGIAVVLGVWLNRVGYSPRVLLRHLRLLIIFMAGRTRPVWRATAYRRRCVLGM